MKTFDAFAKVNLTLEVLGKRPDGFHALRSVVAPIGLADMLTFTPADAFSTDTGYPNDLILKAADVLERHSAVSSRPPYRTRRLQPYAIHVTKRIPVGGGLGGGSADAAVTLLALNELWHLGMTPEDLATLGAEVGSDVPALVLANHYGAPVLMEGRGEVVSLLSLPGAVRTPRALYLVLSNPGVPCSTAMVYGKCQSREDDGGQILEAMRKALASRSIEEIGKAMMNDLQAPALAVCPEIGQSLAVMREAGVKHPMMSGSGSTVFGFVASSDEGRRVIDRIAGTLCQILV